MGLGLLPDGAKLVGVFSVLHDSHLRPKIITPTSPAKLSNGWKFVIRFQVGTGGLIAKGVAVPLMAPSFTSHSFSMNQRLMFLISGRATTVSCSTFEVEVEAPSSGVLAPSGYHLLFVVNGGIPSKGILFQMQ
ncbi:hypothetical protein MRB53_016177 [Persea americana]|uniref:Uncharacterized protein n=1 Tax=Persea americana TaxID=3435 RepID=A0ACC2M224_PERAE|nr:hypothetical protein MRB53_016177 [Persea americana]